MTTADLRAVALELGGDPIIHTRPATAPAGEPLADGTRFTDGTGWIEQASESSGT